MNDDELVSALVQQLHDHTADDRPSARLTGGLEALTVRPQHRVYKLQVLVVPEAAQTWIAIGANRVKLTAVVQSVLEGAPDSGTLASRPDAAVFRDGKFNISFLQQQT